MKYIVLLTSLMSATSAMAGGWAEPINSQESVVMDDCFIYPSRPRCEGDSRNTRSRSENTNENSSNEESNEEENEQEEENNEGEEEEEENSSGQNPGNDKDVGHAPFDGERGEEPGQKEEEK